ncbi:MAG: DnaJ domain-containing protein [Cyclobacteriaceae bacterium]
MQNYYILLEISESATQTEIKAAFKKLAVRYHPDKHAGDEHMAERFKEINEAYQVLSNPYEKARYDIKLTYGRSAETTAYETPTRPAYKPIPKQYRRNYSEAKVDWRENWIATAYAFIFTFIVASVVMLAIFIKNFYDEKQHEELLLERRQRFEVAVENFRMGQIEDALLAFNELTPHMKEEEDMASYTTEIYSDFIEKAETHYYSLQFENAIYYYELIERFSPKKPIVLKEHLAKAYARINQPHEAIKMFTQLLVLGYRNLDCYIAMAEIYRDQLGNLEEAKRYYVHANELAIKQYRSVYGRAYPLVIQGKHLPPMHYNLFTSLAHIYLQLEMYEKALNTTDWNVQIWPDSAENYALAAMGHLALDHTAEACDNFLIASALGYNGTVQIDCNR